MEQRDPTRFLNDVPKYHKGVSDKQYKKDKPQSKYPYGYSKKGADKMSAEYQTKQKGKRGTSDGYMTKRVPSIQEVDENKHKGPVRGIHNGKTYKSVDDYNLSSDDNPKK